jgi:hypothetical protein
MAKRTCPAILSARDEDKLRRASPEDFLTYERLLKRLSDTDLAHERLLSKLDETEEAYDKACKSIDEFTHQMRVILKQMTLFGE